MKKALLSTLFIFLYQFSEAQIRITYSSNNNNLPVSIIKKNDGNYLVFINTYNKTIEPNNTYSTIFTMNSTGKFIDSLILKSSQFYFYLSRFIPVNDGYIGLIGASLKVNNNRFLMITRFNRNLERVRDTMLSLTTSTLAPFFAFDRDSRHAGWDAGTGGGADRASARSSRA